MFVTARLSMPEGIQFETALTKIFERINLLPSDMQSSDEMAGPLSLAFEITRHRWNGFQKKFPHHVEDGRVDDKTNICKFVVTGKVIEYLHAKYKLPELNSPDLFRDLDQIHNEHIDAFSWIDQQIPKAIKGLYPIPDQSGEFALRLGLAVPAGPNLKFCQSGELHQRLLQFFEGSEPEITDSLKKLNIQNVTRNFQNRNKKLREFWRSEFAYAEGIQRQAKARLSNVELTRAAFAGMGFGSPIPRKLWLGVVNPKAS